MFSQNTASVNDGGLPGVKPQAPAPSMLFQAWQLCKAQLDQIEDDDAPELDVLGVELDRIEAEICARPCVTAADLAELFVVQSMDFTVVPQSFDEVVRTLTKRPQVGLGT